MQARSGINFRTKFTIPSTDLNALIVLGVGKFTIASMRFSPILTDPNAIGGQHMSHVFDFSVTIMY